MLQYRMLRHGRNVVNRARGDSVASVRPIWDEAVDGMCRARRQGNQPQRWGLAWVLSIQFLRVGALGNMAKRQDKPTPGPWASLFPRAVVDRRQLHAAMPFPLLYNFHVRSWRAKGSP